MRTRLLLLPVATVLFAQAGIAATGHASAAREVQAPLPAQAASECAFQPPAPILLPNTYPRQTLARRSDNQVIETAQLNKNLRIDILQSACADFVTTEFTLIATGEPGLQRDQKAWIELARATIAGLKTARPAGGYAELDDFLQRAKRLPSTNGALTACRDGSNARPGECAWDSLGGFIFSVKRTRRGTRVSITQYLSG